MVEREQRLVFGEVADAYDDVRAGYPAEIAEKIFRYAGGPAAVVEVGAGTGKATAVFVAAGVPVTCVEPDPAMAAVLSGRFDGRIRLEVRGFEDWSPPAGGVPLICSAQAWHWVDETRRWRLAIDALVPGGVLALFGHRYRFADAAVEREIEAVYRRLAPTLLPPPEDSEDPEKDWFHVEMTGSGLFVDVESTLIRSAVEYPAARYRALLETFSAHRMLDERPRAELLDAVEAVVVRRGGAVMVRLDTVLSMGRRPR
jgi:SAM-dependent methyltransferase